MGSQHFEYAAQEVIIVNQGLLVPPWILPSPVIGTAALKPIKRALFGVEARD